MGWSIDPAEQLVTIYWLKRQPISIDTPKEILLVSSFANSGLFPKNDFVIIFILKLSLNLIADILLKIDTVAMLAIVKLLCE